MCGGGSKTPDTTLQEQEAARQNQQQQEYYQQQLAQQQAEWERQYELQRQTAQQQHDDLMAELQRQQQAQEATAAQAKAERAAEIAQQQQQAQLARQWEQGRQSVLDSAISNVQSAFAGEGDAVGKYQQSVVDSGKPAVEADAVENRRNARYKLADAQNLNSTAAGTVFGGIEAKRQSSLAQLAADAAAKANQYKAGIDANKQAALSSIITAASATGSPTFLSADDVNASLARLQQNLGGISKAGAVF